MGTKAKAAPGANGAGNGKAAKPPLGWVGKLLMPGMPDMDAFMGHGLRRRMHVMACEWVLHGYGVPRSIHLLVYVPKMVLYVWLFLKLCAPAWRAGTDGREGEDNRAAIAAWGFDAFPRFVLYSALFEGLGFGCGSGPLTGKYWPPFVTWIHWLWPGSHKLPCLAMFIGKVPGLGTRRTVFDVAVFVGWVACVVRVLRADAVTPELLLPVVALWFLLGVLDRAIFVATRAEHYLSMTICFMAANPAHRVTGAQMVQVAIWVWAGISKIGPYFPHAVGIMVCNSPVLNFQGLRRALFTDFPNDLTASTFCKLLAHAGTTAELTFPFALASGTPYSLYALVMCLGFHAFITANFAMGAPQEWNIFNVSSAVFLFYFCAHLPENPADGIALGATAALPVWLKVYLGIAIVLVPFIGNAFPRYVSFLLAMRYYAGNWRVSGWMWRASADKKWDKVLKGKAASGMTSNQLGMFWGPKVRLNIMYRVMAFRSMHIHGRLLPQLIRNVIKGESMDGWRYSEGELIAGSVLGYNFGDGFLHDSTLLRHVVQPAAQFAKGELYMISLSACGLFEDEIRWEVWDASKPKPELVGATKLAKLDKTQPY